ncbi:MAG: LamG-like jellyroll fold domain-containing protein, partial [Halobacteriales archaeon]|nr:LamG-like jellyroll fold domain-containing protein [Halobacteriales archaeon]
SLSTLSQGLTIQAYINAESWAGQDGEVVIEKGNTSGDTTVDDFTDEDAVEYAWFSTGASFSNVANPGARGARALKVDSDGFCHIYADDGLTGTDLPAYFEDGDVAHFFVSTDFAESTRVTFNNDGTSYDYVNMRIDEAGTPVTLNWMGTATTTYDASLSTNTTYEVVVDRSGTGVSVDIYDYENGGTLECSLSDTTADTRTANGFGLLLGANHNGNGYIEEVYIEGGGGLDTTWSLFDREGTSGNGSPGMTVSCAGTETTVTGTDESPNTATWYKWDGVYDPTAGDTGTIYVYNNGVGANSGAHATGGSIDSDPTYNVRIGQSNDGTNAFDGLIDELRVAPKARSLGWLKTEYNIHDDSANVLSTSSAEDNTLRFAPDSPVSLSSSFPAPSLTKSFNSVSADVEALSVDTPSPVFTGGTAPTEPEVWRVKFRPSGDIAENVINISSVKAYNRYASHFMVTVDDADGTASADYPRGQRADLQYSEDGGSSWTTKQSGFVQRPADEGDEVGAFTALFIGYDHFLRRENVYVDFPRISVSEALEQVVTQFTPVSWVDANVDVQNDVTVSRSFNGERPDEVINYLAGLSADETYGVNNDFEFFFEQDSLTTASRSVEPGDWYEYDLPEEGRHAVNRVRVFYGSDSAESAKMVVVEDVSAQEDLADKLGAARRVVLSEDVHFARVEGRDEARAIGQEIIRAKDVALTGTVSTFQRYDFEPGELFHLVIPEKNIADEYVIAEVNHDWRRGSTVLKVSENTGNVEDLLIQLSDDVSRIELRGTDAEQINYYQHVNLDVGCTVTGECRVHVYDGDGGSLVETVTGTASPTLYGLNRARKGWGAELPESDVTLPAIDGWALAADDTVPNSSGDGGNVTATESGSSSVTVTSVGADTARLQFTRNAGSFAGETVRDFWFTDADGDSVARGVLDADLTTNASYQYEFEIDLAFGNDTTTRGEWTASGLDAIRDVWVGTDPTGIAPDRRLVGEPGVTVSETDPFNSNATAYANSSYLPAEYTAKGTVLLSSLVDIPDFVGAQVGYVADVCETRDRVYYEVDFDGLSKTDDFIMVPEVYVRFEGARG